MDYKAFLKFSHFRVPQATQDKVYEQIKENAEGDFDFYLLTVFSTIIITLGLLVNSGAVVIGGMLIAPMVWPIFLSALGIIMGRTRIFEKSLLTVLKASIFIFATAYLIGLLTPDVIKNGQEILARTQPTIFELLIALASGFVGAFIVAYPKLGSAMAGVVVAVALVPPLAVTGIAISQNNMESAGGAFLLYVTNLIAITFASGVMFLLARFRGPSTEEGKAMRSVNLRWFIVLLLIVLVPLFFITSTTLREERRQSVVREVLISELGDVQVTEITINEESSNLVNVEVTLQSENNVTKWDVTKLTEILSRNFEQSVVLKITVVPVVEAGKILPALNQEEVAP